MNTDACVGVHGGRCPALDVSKDTVYRLVKKRGMPAHKVARQWKFKASEVDAWARTG